MRQPVFLIQSLHLNSLWSEVMSLSCVRLFVTPWTVAYQAPPSLGFSRQECWSGLPFPSPGYLPDPGIEPGSPSLQANVYRLSHQGSLYCLFKLSGSQGQCGGQPGLITASQETVRCLLTSTMSARGFACRHSLPDHVFSSICFWLKVFSLS